MPFDSVNKKTYINTPKWTPPKRREEDIVRQTDTGTLNPGAKKTLGYQLLTATDTLNPDIKRMNDLRDRRQTQRDNMTNELEGIRWKSQGKDLVTPGVYENAAQRTGRAMQSASQDAYGRVDPSAQRAAMYGQAGLRQNMAMDVEIGRLNEMENARQLYGRGLKSLNEFDLEAALFENERWRQLSDEDLSTAIANDVINRNKAGLELDNIKHAYDQYSSMVENNLLLEQQAKYRQLQNQINSGGNPFGSALEGVGAAAPLAYGIYNDYKENKPYSMDDLDDDLDGINLDHL